MNFGMNWDCQWKGYNVIVDTHETFIITEYRISGVVIRTAPTLKAMITELMLNSGEEIAFWSELESKRVADIWRTTLADVVNRQYRDEKDPDDI